MRLVLASWLLLSFFSLIACHSEEETVTTAVADPCGDANATVKTALNQAGVVRYNTAEKQYTIVTTKAGAQDVGVICDLPDPLKSEGLAVTFSGEYKQYDKTPAQKVSGQTLYYLKITRLLSAKGNFQ